MSPQVPSQELPGSGAMPRPPEGLGPVSAQPSVSHSSVPTDHLLSNTASQQPPPFTWGPRNDQDNGLQGP